MDHRSNTNKCLNYRELAMQPDGHQLSYSNQSITQGSTKDGSSINTAKQMREL